MSFSATKTLLSTSGSGGTPDYWLNEISGSNEKERYVGMHVDSNQNVYLTGEIKDNGPNAFVMKIDSDTSVSWVAELGSTSYEDMGQAVTVDSSGNVYSALWSKTATGGLSDIVVAKYNSSGSLQWQYGYGGAGQNGYDGLKMVLSNYGGTDHLYLAFSSNSKIGHLKLLCSNGNQVHDTLFRDTQYSISAVSGLLVRSNGEVFVAGTTARSPASGSSRSALLLRFSNGDSVEASAAYAITDHNGFDTGCGVAIDSSNGYLLNFTLYSTTASYYPVQIIAFNLVTNNTVWKREFEPSDGHVVNIRNGMGPQLKNDASGNLFVSMSVASNIILAKYNSSGTIQYQKKFDGNVSINPTDLFIDANDDIYISGYIHDSYSEPFVMKMPNAGLSNGTYNLAGALLTSMTVSTYNGSDNDATVDRAIGGISAIDLGSTKATTTLAQGTLNSTSNIGSLE